MACYLSVNKKATIIFRKAESVRTHNEAFVILLYQVILI